MSMREKVELAALMAGGLVVGTIASGAWLVTRCWFWLAVLGYVVWVKL